MKINLKRSEIILMSCGDVEYVNFFIKKKNRSIFKVH